MLLLMTNQARLQTRRGVDFICFICARPGDSCHVTTTATNTPPRKRFSFLLYTIIFYDYIDYITGPSSWYVFYLFIAICAKVWNCVNLHLRFPPIQSHQTAGNNHVTSLVWYWKCLIPLHAIIPVSSCPLLLLGRWYTSRYR